MKLVVNGIVVMEEGTVEEITEKVEAMADQRRYKDGVIKRDCVVLDGDKPQLFAWTHAMYEYPVLEHWSQVWPGMKEQPEFEPVYAGYYLDPVELDIHDTEYVAYSLNPLDLVIGARKHLNDLISQ